MEKPVFELRPTVCAFIYALGENKVAVMDTEEGWR